MHQKIKIIPMKIHKTVATRAAPFGSDIHQIVCRLGLRPLGSLQRSPRPPCWIKGPTSKGRGGKERGGKGGGEGGEGKGKEGECAPPMFISAPLTIYCW